MGRSSSTNGRELATPYGELKAWITLTDKPHELIVEQYNRRGWGVIALHWEAEHTPANAA